MDKYLLLIINSTPNGDNNSTTFNRMYEYFSKDLSLVNKMNGVCGKTSFKVALISDLFDENDCEQFAIWREMLSGETLSNYLYSSIECISNKSAINTTQLSYDNLMGRCLKLMDSLNECFVDLRVFIMNDNEGFEYNTPYISWLNELCLYFSYIYGANISMYTSLLDTLSLPFKDSWNFLINFEWFDFDDFIEWLESDLLWRGVLRYYSPNNDTCTANENVATLFRVETDDENLLKLLDNVVFCPYGLIHYDLKNGSFLENHIDYEAYFQLQFEDNEPFLKRLFEENFFIIELHYFDQRNHTKNYSLWPKLKEYFQTHKFDHVNLDPRLTVFNKKLYCLAKKFEDIEIRCYPLNLSLFDIDNKSSISPIDYEQSYLVFNKENNVKLTPDYKLLEKIGFSCDPNANTTTSSGNVVANSHKTLLKCASFGNNDNLNSKLALKKRNSSTIINVHSKMNKLNDSSLNDHESRRLSSSSAITLKHDNSDKKLLTQIDAVLQRKHNTMETNSPLYKRCRKKLFLVCKTFVSDLDESSSSFIGELYQIVKQNVSQVVKFESAKNNK